MKKFLLLAVAALVAVSADAQLSKKMKSGKLQARRETFEEHLEEIKEMQQLLDADDPKMTTMIESYRRGFQKGITAVSINFIENK